MSQTITNKLDNKHVLSHCVVKLDGTIASEAIMNHLMAAEVHRSLYLPAMFSLKLHSPDLLFANYEQFKIGTEVSISMGHDQQAAPLMTGEVTALEMDATPRLTPTLTVRGYDKLHRLQRGRKTRAFEQVKIGDLVMKLAGEGGLQSEATASTEVYEYILQNNETNYEFLQRWANRLGLELVAEGTKLILRERTIGEKTATLEWGATLTHLVSRMTASQQVDEVVVRGWDSKTKKPIVGNSSSSENQPKVGESKTGKQMAATFGQAKIASVYRAVGSQAEATKIAKAIYDDLAGRFLQVEGTCLGDHNIAVGKAIEITKMGNKLSGKYYVSSCAHRYGLTGYFTDFQATGRQTNTLFELSQPSGSGNGNPELVNSTVVGIVTNLKDPKNKGRVKVKFPWLPLDDKGQEIESTWARVASPMAGKERGFFFLPEVNDEVLVAFEQGDMQRPYILGSLWNGEDGPPKSNDAALGSGGKVKERMLKTTSGHTISFDDSDDEAKIIIVDKTGKNKITIDSTKNNIVIECDADLELKATKGKLALSAKDIEITAQSSAKIKGMQFEAEGSSGAKITSSGNTVIKGSMVQIN